MLEQEPMIRVGIQERVQRVDGLFNGLYRVDGGGLVSGAFSARVAGGAIWMADPAGTEMAHGRVIRCRGEGASTFTLSEVTIGIRFHWERRQPQSFPGDLVLEANADGTMTVINEVFLEDYLGSVISSEMSPGAPPAFLEAHAIASRSWLAVMLERKHLGVSLERTVRQEGVLLRWYDREDHDRFDVCADDHCQRYHGITAASGTAAESAQRTRGIFLVHGDSLCDARFHKACGGLTEDFATAWEDRSIPYLRSVADAPVARRALQTEGEAQAWILSSPEAYCNMTDRVVLRQILPAFDQETSDFFRWSVTYEREELEDILQKKSGLDFGTLRDLVPLTRGPSGRITRIRIEGSRLAMEVGKELEIRRWLSRSHLYSSAFTVTAERDGGGLPARFVLHGAGWGHGVGMCQIGGAVMAMRGFTAEEILTHYFRGAALKRLYP